MKRFTLTLVLSLVAVFIYAQDRIIKIDGSEILCHVKEIGSIEIKYTKADNPDGPLYVINRSEVRKIIFENGTEEVITQNALSVVPNAQKRMYKRAITTRPFGPLIGFVCVGYQQAMTSTRAIVGEVGFIGPHAGNTLGEDATGGYIRVGYRLKRTPEVVMPGMEWGYNLGGFYVQPELTFSAFSRTSTYYNYSTGTYSSRTSRKSSGAFMIAVGRQMIVGDIVTFDLGGSIGYAYVDQSSSSSGFLDYSPIYYSHSAFGSDFPMAYKFTLSMGVLLK